MSRVKRGVTQRAKHKKILKMARGYYGRKSKLFKVAKQQVWKSGNYAFAHRRLKKREFRRLWIARINAATRLNGMSYSRFMSGLKSLGIMLDRKVLADMALNQAADFAKLVEMVKNK
ncbi:50S ribosomal protein L20 [Amygdalobacter nucleatus]|uniref:Large ribosomal subunit protein bL20 n=1 Tax=Amygdalobacter nucleatus TaxID=3029274 RepID=A0A133YAF6_9FIRM|nr:50S ribosomal protein L20 [Amygdalobacter nucleatus]KXB40180.1 ribosomal protein L20 [Amygdalobacter nucleatus]MDF0485790.1 50S ribosomal protein L20 [Amygdalobacter nucleatus]WEG36376.1 50S ribosomal protein L20 [Amygdalobacter nucleatus]